MIIFLFSALITFSSSLYLGELSYTDYKYNCSTLFGLPVALYSLSAFLLLLVCILSFIKVLRKHWYFSLACGGLLGGGSYHTYARLSDGCVLDYFHWTSLYFNISDVFIVTAVIFLIIFSFISSEP